MAKIIFLQNNNFDLHGPMYISGLLKYHGHYCELFVVPQEDTRQLTNLAKLFSFAVKNRFFRWIMPALIKLPPNIIFHFMFLVAFALRHAKANRMSLFEEFKFNTKHLKGYFKKKEIIPLFNLVQ